MPTVIDYLSKEAKNILSEFYENDLGVVSAYRQNVTDEENLRFTTELLIDSAFYGRFKIKEYGQNGSLLKVSLLLNGGGVDSPRSLVSFLKKETDKFNSPYFLFKSYKNNKFSQINNPNVFDVKYDYNSRVVKLSHIPSFFHQNNIEY